MKKTIVLTFTAVLFIASSILAFANMNIDEISKKSPKEQCPPNCCDTDNCCTESSSNCCKK